MERLNRMDVERVWRARMAGFLYPSDPVVLQAELERLAPRRDVRSACGIIVPHSNLEWCGVVTGDVMAAMDIPRRCVILSPNHTGSGVGWSLLRRGAMRTPFGEVAIDEDLSGTLHGLCPRLEGDEVAHVGEHGIEALLPWLRWKRGASLRIVPIVARSDSFEEAMQVADALSKAIRQVEEPVVVIASAEFAQFRPVDEIRATDARLLESLSGLDARAFGDAVKESHVSMCGATVIACALEAVRHLGGTSARVMRSATSADAGGDPHSSTGYAGVIFE